MRLSFYIQTFVFLCISFSLKAQYNGVEYCFKSNTPSIETISKEVQRLVSSLDSIKQRHGFDKGVNYSIVYYYSDAMDSNEAGEKCLWIDLVFRISEELFNQHAIRATVMFSNYKVFNNKVESDHVCISPSWP